MVKPQEIDFNIDITEKQQMFIDATEDEVFYGGAAGGGKSFAQLIDILWKASEFPGIKQIIFRRSFPELEKSVIRVALDFYPKDLFSYNKQSHSMTFSLGDKPSILDFSYLEKYEDTAKHQSAEYDIIRFDEATHFDPDAYVYMLSRNRGANRFPKQIKSSSNPGKQGHEFFKGRFLTGHVPMKPFKDNLRRSYIYIPSLVTENPFLMEKDPGYINRLMQLPEAEREALLNGSWDTYTGIAFPEFDWNINTCEPFAIPDHWYRWMGCDNGYTDPFSWGWYTVSPDGIVYRYRGFTRDYDDPKILYDEQARQVIDLMTRKKINEFGQIVDEREKISYIVAGTDAWSQHHRDQSGKDLTDMYAEGGLTGFIRAETDRKLRKATIHQHLALLGNDPVTEKPYSRLQIMRNSSNQPLINNLPALQEDEKDSEKYADCSTDHDTDELGYALISHYVKASKDPKAEKSRIQKHKESKTHKSHRRR